MHYAIDVIIQWVINHYKWRMQFRHRNLVTDTRQTDGQHGYLHKLNLPQNKSILTYEKEPAFGDNDLMTLTDEREVTFLYHLVKNKQLAISVDF